VCQIFRLVALVFLLAAVVPATADVPDDVSPTAAIRLVLDTQTQKIRSVDSQDGWSHDTKERAWSAQRLVEPGFVDTTHMFIVSYKIDGVVMLSWRVDTHAGAAIELL
jgi:hypothetical protein